jgi:energy-coupling factor transporter ATP-binding protein EcfA2
MSGQVLISVRDLSFRYRGAAADALRDVSFDVCAGDFLGVGGGSGSGKSTLLHALCGVVPHHVPGDFYGSVHICGEDSVDTPPVQLARHVGLVMQDSESQFVMTMVGDEVRFGLRNFGFDDVDGRAYAALEMLGAASLEQLPVRSLSGGQKRKVALAAMLALKPQVLLLDEPTAELDPASKDQLFATLAELNDQGLTIVVSEKNTNLLDGYCKTQISMEDGHVSF